MMQPSDAEETQPQIHQNEVFQMLFNEKLIQRRRERGMTQEELADRLSVSRQTVSKWENGDCMPDADKFIRLSDILEISLDELAGREVEVAPIVLPAPEVPQPRRSLRRSLAAAAVCLLLCAGCFCLGRYAFPKTSPAAPAETARRAALPNTVTVSGLSQTLGLTGDGMAFGFVSNVSVDGIVVFYPEDGFGPIRFNAKYANGTYTTEPIPTGRYSKAVFVVSDGDWERTALLAEDIVIDPEGASWANP
jgi:transcriptional regulator with XRE-family HTH domain